MTTAMLSRCIAFIALALITGCGIDYDTDAQITRFKPEAYRKIKSWSVKLAYGNSELGGAPDQSQEIRKHLSFIEDVNYWLKKSESVQVQPNGEGCISISVDELDRYGGIYVVSVRLLDATGTVLCRMKIRDTSQGGNTSFQHYLAIHITRELNYSPTNR